MPAKNVKPTPGAYDPVHDAYDAGGWSYTPVPSGGTSSGYTSSTQSDKLIVRYNTYSGVTGNPPVEAQVSYSGEPKTVTLESEIKENEYNMVKGTGYYFIGWSLNSSGNSLSYKPGDIISNTWSKYSSGTVTINLYPFFINTNVFIYMPDDDTNEKYTRFSEKRSGVSTNLSGALFTRKGYAQVGWSFTKGGEKAYDIGASIIPNSNDIVVLYPFWGANIYHITLHGNGSEQSDQVIPVLYGSEITIASDSSNILLGLSQSMIDVNNNIVLNNDTDWYLTSNDYIIVTSTISFYRVGYHIDSWVESPDGDGPRWEAGATYVYTRDSDVDLYAVWKGDQFKVYYREEGSAPGEYLHTSTAVYGEPFYTERLPYPDDRRYYTFSGWEDLDGNELTKADCWFDAYYYGDSPTWSILGDLVITRKWSPFYPFGKIFFGGKYSDEFDIYVEKPPSFKWPEYEYEHEKVAGQNGDSLKDLGRYSNVSCEYEISAYDYVDYKSVSKKVSEWLHRETNGAYLRLEDSYEPDIYRLAIYEEGNTFENVLAKAGKCKLTFNCKPQKFLISGDTPIEITSTEKEIVNPTNHSSVPIITIYGTGKFRINDIEISVLNNYNYIVLDCETYDAVSASGRNMNQYMYCMDSILLKPGVNKISFDSEIEKLIITPRWWRV